MHPLQRWIDRFHQRILIGEFLQRAAEGLALFLFIFGTAVLAVRLTLPQFWPHVLWLMIGACPVAWYTWRSAVTQLQPRRLTIAMLDQRLDAGGLLMTFEERPSPEWTAQLTGLAAECQDVLPRLRPRRFLSFLSLPVIFSIAACFVPLREAQSTPVTPYEVAQQATEKLEQLKDALEEAQILNQEEKQQIQEEIEKIQQETQGTPLSHENWETLDALQERLQLRINEAAAKSQKLQNAVGRLADLGKGLDQNLTPDEKRQLEQDVEEGIEELMKKAKEDEQNVSQGKQSKLSPELQKQLQTLMKDGRPQLPKDPTERQELLNQLKEELEKEKQKLEELREQARQRGQNPGERGDGQEGEDGPGDGENGEGQPSDQPGQGGLTRGRGDADLTWGEESDAKKTKFKEVVLPPGFMDKPKDEIAGVKVVAPTEDAKGGSAKRSLNDAKASLGETTWDRRLSPRHRNIVKQYFKTESNNKKPM